MIQILDQILLSGKNSVTEYLLNEKRKEGIREGIREGKREGKREERQDSIVVILQTRFGSMDDDIKAQVKKIQDERILKELFHTSILVKSLDEFKKTLSQKSGISLKG
ncbi:MAG: hypothetical protein GX766_02345 [Firmicutes bacterium]|jgi:DNA invertase Pin-like site-specific DNA recombinase|nr:hypothetical protein [Bacillota bacterium]